MEYKTDTSPKYLMNKSYCKTLVNVYYLFLNSS